MPSTDDRLAAVLVEPQLTRFRHVFGLDGVELAVTFEGWHRYAIISPDRVFLIPRSHVWVDGMSREAQLLGSLTGVLAPRLIGQWHDPDISPYRVTVLARLPGETWSHHEQDATLDQLIALMTQLGKAIAAWHAVDPTRLALQTLPEQTHFLELMRPETLGATATRVAAAAGIDAARIPVWLRVLGPLVDLEPVLVHGDINEGQILLDSSAVLTGILDWESAGLCHPLKDFDFGEWGRALWDWQPQFGDLRHVLWDAYANARGVDLPPWEAIHLFFTLIEFPLGLLASDWDRQRRQTSIAALNAIDLVCDQS